jgi:NADPH2:quinone reductase
MKALLCHAYGPPEALRLGTAPDPVPGPGDILVDVAAAALNFPDVLAIQNRYQVRPPLPFAPGVEIAGRVAACGAGVARFRPGDRVAAYVNFGGFAEKALARADHAVAVPDGVTDAAASTLPINYATSWYALTERGNLRGGESLLVLGASGGVGLAAVQIGKALGAHVTAAASSAEKLDLCRREGADAVVDYGTGDLREGLKAIRPAGFDLVFDPVGGGYSEPAFRALAWRGRFLTIGYANGEIPRLPLNLALLNERTIIGVAWGAAASRDGTLFGRAMSALFAMITDGRFAPAISERVPLEGAAAAMRAMMDRRVTGKVVVEMR